MPEFRLAFEVLCPRPVSEVSIGFYEHFDGVVAEHGGRVTAMVYAQAATGVEAAYIMVSQLETRLGLSVTRLDLDLVDGPEIAERLNVSRQAVNLWAKGRRRDSFPLPLGSPGGKRIWAWGQVTAWAAEQGLLDEPPALTLDEMAEVDAYLAARRVRLTVGTPATSLVSGGSSKRLGYGEDYSLDRPVRMEAAHT